MAKNSVEKLLRDALRDRMGDLNKVKSDVASIRNAIKAIQGSATVVRASSNGHTVTCRGLTKDIAKYLVDHGPKTPQELHKLFKAKSFESLKASLSTAFRTGKLSRTTNSKGFFEYDVPNKD